MYKNSHFQNKFNDKMANTINVDIFSQRIKTSQCFTGLWSVTTL